MIEKENDVNINKAITILRTMSIDEQMKNETIRREIAMMDEASFLADALDKGRKEGRQQGLQQGLQQGADEKAKDIVFRMIMMNQPEENIKLIMNITDDDMKKYKAEYNSVRENKDK